MDELNSMDKMDVIVVGGGLAGCVAALKAAETGKRVALVESRAFLGHELCSTGRNWINNGFTEFELPLALGSVKKFFIRQLLDAGVEVLFMSHAAGVGHREGRATGLLIANKYGLQFLPGDKLIDATASRCLSRLINDTPGPFGRVRVHYVIGFRDTGYMYRSGEAVPEELGLWENKVDFHYGAESRTLSVSFSFEAEVDKAVRNREFLLSNKAKLKAGELMGWLRAHVPGLTEARCRTLPSEAALSWLDLEEPESGESSILKGVFTLPGMEAAFEGTGQARKHFRRVEMLTEEFVAASWREKGPESLLPEQILLGKTRIEAEQCRFSRFDSQWQVPLQRVEWDPMGVADVMESQALICGMGTAGSMAYRALCESNVQALVLELNRELGGTRVVGLVGGYWHGYKKGLNEKVDAEEAETAKITGDQETGRILYNHHYVKDRSESIHTGALACGAVARDGVLKAVLAADDNGLFLIKAGVTMDFTGDGDLIAFLGLPYSYGDPKDGIPQTYSQWGIDEQNSGIFRNSRYLMDFDVICHDKYRELLRGIYLAHTRNSDLNFSEMLTVRESRRFVGDYTLTLEDIFLGKRFQDCVAVTSTPLDTHGLTSTIYDRMGYVRFSHDEINTRIPYRCYLPKGMEGLLVGAKAMSADREAACMCRMNADLRNSGYALGLAAAEALRTGKTPRNIDIKPVQKKLAEAGILPDWVFEPVKEPSLSELARAVANGEEGASFRAMLLNDPGIAPLIEKELSESRNGDLTDTVPFSAVQVLAWFSREKALDEVARRLLSDVRTCYDLNRNVKAENPDIYREVSQCLALLEKSGKAAYGKAVAWAAELMGPGGPLDHAPTPYSHSRVDTWRLPHHDQLLSLASALLTLPGSDAEAPLSRLLKDASIKGFVSRKESSAVKPFFSSLLELSIARALYACGGSEALPVLEAYKEDVREVLSQMARKTLDQ